MCDVAGYVSESESESDVSSLANEIVLKVIGDGDNEETKSSNKVSHQKEQVSPETKAKTARKAYSLNRASSLSTGPPARVKKSKSVRFSTSPVSPPSAPPTPQSAPPMNDQAPPTTQPAPPPSTATPPTSSTMAATSAISTTQRDQPVAITQEKLPAKLPWKQTVPVSNKVECVLRHSPYLGDLHSLSCSV